ARLSPGGLRARLHGSAADPWPRAWGAARADPADARHARLRVRLARRRPPWCDDRRSGFESAKVRRQMSTLFEELSRVKTYEYTEDDVVRFEALHEEIRALKQQRNAVIVAHNYYRPEILKVADFVGDSLELALMAAQVKDADIIDFCGVHFMAETAKIVNPKKKVLLPNPMAG